MKKFLCSFTVICLIIGACVSNVQAYNYIGKQRSIEFSFDDLLMLFEDGGEMTEPAQMAKLVFATSVQDLLQKAEDRGLSPEITESIFHISEEKMRVDTEDMMGKMSMLMRLDKGMLYMIMWAKNQYIEMSMEDMMKKMQATAQNAMKSQQDIFSRSQRVLW